MKNEELIEHIEELDDDRGFTELAAGALKRLSDKAALFVIADEDYWFPYSQLRHLDGEIYATEWIMKQKGLL